MKKTFHLIFPVIFFIINGFGIVNAQTNIIVWQKSGGINPSAFSTVDRITFSSGNFIVKKTDSSTDSYLISDIKYMTFGQFSEVKNLNSQSELILYPNPANAYINIKNAFAGSKIDIYKLDGSKLISVDINSDCQQIDISTLAKGLYLAKINNVIYKFTKQ